MKLFRNIFEKPAAYLEYVSCALLTIAIIITIANVVMRQLLKAPIYGAIEMIQYTVLLAICFGLPSCTLHGGHAKVTLLLEALSRSARIIVNVIVDLISIVLFGVISYNLFGSVETVMRTGRTTDVFKVPFQYVYYAIIFGLILMIFILLFCMISELIHLKSDQNQTVSDIDR